MNTERRQFGLKKKKKNEKTKFFNINEMKNNNNYHLWGLNHYLKK